MNGYMKVASLLLLAVAIAGTFALKQRPEPLENNVADGATTQGLASDEETEALSATGGIPKLVDLGADQCIPCKMMAPMLAELKRDYAGRMDVEFIDVWKNPNAGSTYGIRMIPTQIFYDAEGKELLRHEGYISKEDILAKWTELGVELGDAAAPPTV